MGLGVSCSHESAAAHHFTSVAGLCTRNQLAHERREDGVREQVAHARVLCGGACIFLCAHSCRFRGALRVRSLPLLRPLVQNVEMRERRKKWKKAVHKKWGIRQERVSKVFFNHADRDRTGMWTEYVASERTVCCLLLLFVSVHHV